jgi:histidine triad (HIT) family protein
MGQPQEVRHARCASRSGELRLIFPVDVGGLRSLYEAMDCVFCRIAAGSEPAEIIYQDDEVVVFKDYRPRAPIHLLICPKAHYPDFLSAPPEVHRKLTETVSQISHKLGERAKQFRLVVNNGPNWGQIIFHLHYHFLAGDR